MKFLKALILFSVLLSLSANALLEVSIIKSKEELFPIVIAPFEVIGEAQQGADIANIISKRYIEVPRIKKIISDNV